MKPQTKLDPELLKHFRKERGFTLRDVALKTMGPGIPKQRENSCIRMYQAIEKTGKTSPERAERIAEALELSVRDLVAPTDMTRNYWWVSMVPDPTSAAIGSVFFGHQSVIGELEKFWPERAERWMSPDVEVTMNFDRRRKPYQLTLQRPGTELELRAEFCPCRIIPNQGIEWEDPNQWERTFFENSLKLFLFNNAYIVWFDGKRFPPDGSAEVLFLTSNFFDWQILPEPKRVALTDSPNSQLFESLAQFELSLHAFLQHHSSDLVEFVSTSSGIEITIAKSPEPHQKLSLLALVRKFQVTVGWVDDNKIFYQGPWPEKWRLFLIERWKYLTTTTLRLQYEGVAPPFDVLDGDAP